MSDNVRAVNTFFKNATKEDVENIMDSILLSDRQGEIFSMFYVKKLDAGHIAEKFNVTEYVIYKELVSIRSKVLPLIRTKV